MSSKARTNSAFLVCPFERRSGASFASRSVLSFLASIWRAWASACKDRRSAATSANGRCFGLRPDPGLFPPCEPFAETDGESLSRKEKTILANSVSIERKVCTPRRCTARQQAQRANCRAWKIKIPQSGVLTCMGSKIAYLDD